jgi:hypothetical protein
MDTGDTVKAGTSAIDNILLGNPPMSTSSMPEMRLGEKVSIAEKLRWIQMPQNDDHKNAVQWWPGVIYDSFMELIQDVGESVLAIHMYSIECRT